MVASAALTHALHSSRTLPTAASRAPALLSAKVFFLLIFTVLGIKLLHLWSLQCALKAFKYDNEYDLYLGQHSQ